MSVSENGSAAATNAAPTLAIDQAVKTYPNGYQAVHGVSLTVEQGELCVFVGPSGCGKSTLLRMVAGLESVSAGEIRLSGRRVNELEPADRDIAMVFQNYALYPHMTVYRNLAYGLQNRRTPREEIDRKVREAADLLQIGALLDRKPQQLSGGQRQRVAMGRAIVRDPAIFLFDEPLSNLDAKLRNQMRLEIRKLQRRLGVAAVYVTHDQVEAMTLADKIVVLNGGRIEQIGTPHDVYHRPASAFVASFIGAPPMNLVDGVIVNGAVRLPGGGEMPAPRSGAGPIRVGVRPERLTPAEPGAPGAAAIEVDLVEELGASRLIHGRWGDAAVTISIDGAAAPPEGRFWVRLDPRDIHFFDHESGRRI